MTEPLRMCPFCGIDDEGRAGEGDMCSDQHEGQPPFFWIQCARCEACGPTADDEDSATAKWNRAPRE